MEPQRQNSLYFINPWVDTLFIGGFSVLVFVLLKTMNLNSSFNYVAVAASLTWICNNPHFAATNYRLYHSKRNIMQFPVTAILVPILVTIGMAGSLAYPETVAPIFIKLFILWSPYHFSGQSVGITMVYARRAGFKVGLWERRAFSGFIFTAFASTLLLYETGTQPLDHYGIKYPTFGVPLWTVDVAHVVMAVCGIGILFFAGKWSIKSKKLLPPIVLVPALTHFVWFVGGREHAEFDEFVPFFHSAQYLFIAWAVQLKEKSDKKKIPLTKNFASIETLRWWGFNVVLGVTLFEGLPYLVPVGPAQTVMAYGVVSAGVQLHHFFVDGVIWKLRNDTNAHPLMASISNEVKLNSKSEEASGLSLAGEQA